MNADRRKQIEAVVTTLKGLQTIVVGFGGACQCSRGTDPRRYELLETLENICTSFNDQVARGDRRPSVG